LLRQHSPHQHARRSEHVRRSELARRKRTRGGSAHARAVARGSVWRSLAYAKRRPGFDLETSVRDGRHALGGQV